MTTQEIADFLAGELIGDGSTVVTGIASIEAAGEHDIAFLASAGQTPGTRAACLIVPKTYQPSDSRTLIKVDDPKLAFARIAPYILSTSKSKKEPPHQSAVIDPTADVRADHVGAFAAIGAGTVIADGCRIHAGVRIGRNVRIGEDTEVFPNCVIYDNVTIGAKCVFHGGVVIGAPGFGYVKDEGGSYHQFPQVGTVVIEDEVEIGANTCIDRGALGETRIGKGTKIDNLVQIGHNVQIGARVVIAAQTGISGSTVIEDDCVIGGQVGMGDHAKVLTGAVIGSQAGVLPGKIVREGIWWGTPVQPLEEYKRQNAHVKGLARLKEQVRRIKDDIDALKNTGS